ncbi:MAG TPA: NUDIX hydrolase [Anaerolineaceae bacterium]|nr:NUDIX hydrolase [Anaerolineaceae bacterium]
MKSVVGPLWLDWARDIQAIGQTGLHFSSNDFDRMRYQRLIDIASEIFSKASDLPVETFNQIFMAERGYACPKIDVRAAVFQEDRVLLVRERQDGGWSLPGGWADVNEPPSSMVEREVREESGYQVKACQVIGVYEANHDREPIAVYHAYKIVFLCDLLGGEATISNETSAVGFFNVDDLPPLSPFRTQPRYIQDAYALLHDPALSAVFD